MKAKWESATCEVVVFDSLDIVTASDLYEGEIDRTSLYSSRPSTAGDWN